MPNGRIYEAALTYRVWVGVAQKRSFGRPGLACTYPAATLKLSQNHPFRTVFMSGCQVCAFGRGRRCDWWTVRHEPEQHHKAPHAEVDARLCHNPGRARQPGPPDIGRATRGRLRTIHFEESRLRSHTGQESTPVRKAVAAMAQAHILPNYSAWPEVLFCV